MIGPARIDSAEGHAIALEGEQMIFVLSRAFAPGTPFRGVIRLDGDELAVEGRATGSKRTSEGTFQVRARMINLRREDRERLKAASASRGAPQ